jgi:hypothetical protein
MKKVIIILIFSFLSSVHAQDKAKEKNKLRAFGELTSYNFLEYNYTLDVNYKLGDYTSLSSWNTITSGRNESQGYNYSVVSAMINFSDKKQNVFSVGYGNINQMFYNRSNNSFIVKLRVRIF